MLAVFSLSGGVGKTSLAAAVGRALSADGDRTLLADATTGGILPYHFGAQVSNSGVLRTFAPTAGRTDAPITLLRERPGPSPHADQATRATLFEQILETCDAHDALVVDLSPTALSLLRQLASLNAAVLVPVLPELNTVLGLRAVEAFFTKVFDAEGRPVQPLYLLTQFDAALPLHLDVREVMRQRLGDRLLPFVIRRSQEVPDALAEGMTVIDYAPDSGAASDYRTVATWFKAFWESAGSHTRSQSRITRWGEQ